MAHAATAQASDKEWQTVHGKRHKHALVRLQRSLARTLDDLYQACEENTGTELVESTLRYLEQTVDDFRLLAQTGASSTTVATSAAAGQAPPANTGCSSICTVPTAVATSSCTVSCSGSSSASTSCSSSCSMPAAGSKGLPGSKLPGSRLARTSSTADDPAGPCCEDSEGANPNNSPGDAGEPDRGSRACSNHAPGSSNSSVVNSTSSSSGSTGNASTSTEGTCVAWQGHKNWGTVFAAGASAPAPLHNKLSSPDRLRKSPCETKAAAEERQARAERLRERLAEEKLARLQEQLAKQQRRVAAGKAQVQEEASSLSSSAAIRSADKHQRSELLRAAHLHRIKAKAGDETRKVHEVSFINTLTNQGKKADLQQRLEEGEARRAEALAAKMAKQQEAAANIREAAERRRQAEAERLAQLADKQRRKQEAQAKMEGERRAAAAAREAARAAARAFAQQREAARQRQASELREKVSARLKQAAQRRLQHLELIRERAALGKDFDRRDSFAHGSSSGRSSPAGQPLSATRAAPQQQQQQQEQQVQTESLPSTLAAQSSPAGVIEVSTDSVLVRDTPAKLSKSNLNAMAPCFCPAGSQGNSRAAAGFAPQHPLHSSLGSNSGSGDDNGSSGSNSSTNGNSSTESNANQAVSVQASSPSSPAASMPLPCEVLDQLRGNSQSISASGLTAAPSSLKSTLKGARRRMAKARHKMLQPGCCFQAPEQGQLLSQTLEGQQLLAAWAPHLALLQLQQPIPLCYLPSAAAAAVQPTALARTPAGEPEAAGAAAAAPVGLSPPEAAGLSGLCSSGSSSTTNSPRSSVSSYAAGYLSTSTFSSTAAGSPVPYSPAAVSCQTISRSSSCCDCDSQHNTASAAAAAALSSRGGTGAASDEQQREALAALVASARAHVTKEPLLVSHLARHSGLLYRLCQEVLSVCSGRDSNKLSSSNSSSSVESQASAAAQAKARQDRLQQARLLELLGRLLELPANLDYLLSCGQLLPEFVSATRMALDHCNSLEADEPSMRTGGEAASRLSILLQVLVDVLEHNPGSPELIAMQDQLVGFMVAAGLIGRLASVFSLFDQPMQQAARPVPPYVLQCLRLLGGLTAVRCVADELLPGKLWPSVAPNASFIVLEMQATSMAGVLSLLTAVLLNASPTCTPAEASSRALPPNFVEAAHLVMAVLNNVCRLDLLAAQYMLSCAHHRLEFYHLISFLLSYCLSRWPAAPAPAPAAGQQSAAVAAGRAVHQQELQQHQQQQNSGQTCRQQLQQPVQLYVYPASPSCVGPGQAAAADLPAAVAAGTSASSNSSRSSSGSSSSAGVAIGSKAETGRPPGAAVMHHPIAQLLNEVLLLIGYFCVQHPSNQAMLTWGKSPSILQRLCSLPKQYLEVPELRAVLMPTLLCVCHGAERSCEIVAQHLSLETLLHHVQLEQQQQHGDLQQQEPQQEQQQQAAAAMLTRQERRRQRRQQQRQHVEQEQQQGEQQLQKLQEHLQQCGQGKGQQLQPHAQAVLEQMRDCSSRTSSSGSGVAGAADDDGSTHDSCKCNSTAASSSSCDGGGSSSNGDSSSSGRSIPAGQRWQAVFSLSKRFPNQLLSAAKQQLQGVIQAHSAAGSATESDASGAQAEAARAASIHAPRAVAAVNQPASTAGNVSSCHHTKQPAGSVGVCGQQRQLQPAAAEQYAAWKTAVSAESASTNSTVKLQLHSQQQQAAATNMLVCEVIACS